MPITQDRLLSLITILDNHYARIRTLTDQSIRIRYDIINAINERNDELAFTYLDQLMNEIQLATRIREAEYSTYMGEKKHLEINANHNARSKAIMLRNRERIGERLGNSHEIISNTSTYQDREDAKQLMQHVQTEQKANEETEIPEKKLILKALEIYARLDRDFRHDIHPPVDAFIIAAALKESEGTTNKIIIPYLLSQGLLTQPDPTIRAYIPKRRMGE